MDIGLIDVDGHNYPNFALMRISAYYKQRGHSVEWAKKKDSGAHYNIIFASKIFTFSPDFDEEEYSADDIIEGGSGYNISSKLPTEIEDSVLMDYDLYDYPFSIQFFSRGCIRKCKFCLARKKEGYIRPVKPAQIGRAHV